MIMKKIIKTLVVALSVFSASVCTFAAPPLTTIQKAKAMVEEARYQLPVQANYNLLWTQVDYDSKTYSLVYKYYYTVPITKPSNEAINEAKLSIIHLLKANPSSEDTQFIKAGMSFHYKYYSLEGKFLYAIRITSADIK